VTDARDKEWAGMKYTIQVAPKIALGVASASMLPRQKQD
jgi:hypothetical protein